MIVKVGGEASRGAYSVIEYSHAAGAAGPPAHVHYHHEEAFYVIDGQLTLTVDGETVTLDPGQSAVVPRGRVHRPGNTASRPVRFIFISSPPMDEFFDELSRLITEAGGEPSVSALRQLGARYDSIFVGLPSAGNVRMHSEGP
jgi:mannose-6-phosphate isomerase-like protein (cupin superfamily)